MEQNQFEYSGHLIYSPFLMRFKNESPPYSESISRLLDELPKYSEGSPDKPGEGYLDFNLQNHAVSESELSGEILESFEDWRGLQYRWEEYTSEEAFVSGEKREVEIPSYDSADLFIHPSGVVLLRGKNAAVRKAETSLQRSAGGDLLIQPLEIQAGEILARFGPSSDRHDPEIELERLKKAEFAHVSEFTDRVSISGEDIFSNSFAEKSQQNGQIISISPNFNFRDFRLHAKVDRHKIFVRAQGGLKDLSSASRLVLSILFCYELIENQVNRGVGF